MARRRRLVLLSIAIAMVAGLGALWLASTQPRSHDADAPTTASADTKAPAERSPVAAPLAAQPPRDGVPARAKPDAETGIVVRIRDAGGRLVVGAAVRVAASGAEDRGAGRTDEHGEVTARVRARPGVRVVVAAADTYGDGGEDVSFDGDGVPPPTVEVTVPRRIPWIVEIVEADSGRPSRRSVVRVGDSEWSEESVRRATIVDLDGRLSAYVGFAVEAAPGFAAWDEPPAIALVARRTTAIRHVFPVRPTARVDLIVRDSDGTVMRPAARTADDAPESLDLALRASVGGRNVSMRWRSTGLERAPVEGIPHLRGERVILTALSAVVRGASETNPAFASWEGMFGATPEDPLHAEIRFPPPVDPEQSLIGIGGGAGGAFKGIGGGHRNPRPVIGRVEATVLDRAGAPLTETLVRLCAQQGDGARGWTIASQRTDRAGRVVFNDVTIADGFVATIEEGVVETDAPFHLDPGSTARVTLRERQGGTIEVSVVDEDGEGLPFATVEVGNSGFWFDLDDAGVQRTDPFTDANGRRTLTHVRPGNAMIAAKFGERSAWAVVEARDGETTQMRLVVVRPSK